MVATSLEGLRGGIYARKSAYHGKLKSRGRSVREQLAAGHADAERLSVKVVEEFVDDDRSASRHGDGSEREAFERMIESVEARQLDIVLAWGSTRLQRDVAVYARLRDACAANGVLWCYGGKIYDLSDKDDRFRTGLDALLGEREVDELRGNVMRTLRANAVAGRPHSQVAYGYRRIYDEHTGAFLRIEPESGEAEIIEEIVDRVGTLESRSAIARDLDQRGVTPPTAQWTRSQVRRLATWGRTTPGNDQLHPSTLARIEAHTELRMEAAERLAANESDLDIARDFNERQEPLLMAVWHARTVTAFATDVRYIGVRTHNGKVTAEDAWPALVTKAAHARAVAAVKGQRGKQKPNKRPGKATRWLSEIMVCDTCSVPVKADMKHGQPRYSCKAPGVGGAKGYHSSALMGVVDEHVEKRLFAWLTSPKFAEAYAESDQDVAAQIKEAEAEAELLRARLEEFYKEAGAGNLSARALAAIEAENLPKIEDAKRRAEALRTPAIVRDIVGVSSKEVREAWKSLDLQQRRLLTEALLEVRLKPQGTGQRDVAVESFVSVTPKVPAHRSKPVGQAHVASAA